MNRFHRFLRWSRVEDRDGKLSLTSIAFAIAMYCLLSGKALSLTELGAFVTAITAHRHRQATDADAVADALPVSP